MHQDQSLKVLFKRMLKMQLLSLNQILICTVYIAKPGGITYMLYLREKPQ